VGRRDGPPVDGVFVTFGDERLQTIGVWLRPEDVRRR